MVNNVVIKKVMITALLKLIFLLPLFWVSSTFAESTSIPLEGTNYIAYYQEPIEKDYPIMLNVVFYKNKPSRIQLDKFLHAQLAIAVVIEGKKDIMAQAWYSSTGKQEDEEMLPIKEGVMNLVYKANQDKIIYYKLGAS